MTAAAVRPHPLDSDPTGPDRRLVELLDDLDRLGVHGRILTDWVAGEPDVRLQIRRDVEELTVELLWRCQDMPAPSQPEAVRIAGDTRVVWRSVHGRCAPADIVRFLCDLLLLDEGTLTRRHLRLG